VVRTTAGAHHLVCSMARTVWGSNLGNRPVGPVARCPLYSPSSGVPRCDGVVREASLRPDPNSNPNANPHPPAESSRVSPPRRP
jgi:hypothetical protein